MTEIEYHLYSKNPATNLSPLSSLLMSKEASELLDFIGKAEEYGVTLKKIKLNFQPFTQYEKVLEDLIEWQVVRRNDGRYLRSIPVITEKDLTKITKVTAGIALEVVESLKSLENEFYRLLKELNSEEDELTAYHILVNGRVFQQTIQELMISDCEENNYLERKTSQFNLLMYTAELSSFARETAQLYGSINFEGQRYLRFYQGSDDLLDVQSYLEILEDPKLLLSRSELEKVYQLLGDLNPTYFLENCGSRLKRVQRKGFFKEKNSDIFTEALILLGYLSKEGMEVRSLVPIYRDNAQKIEQATEKITACLVSKLEPHQVVLKELANECSGVSFAVPGNLYLIEIYQLLFSEVSKKWQEANLFKSSDHPNKLVII